VYVDDEWAAGELTRHLIEKGYKRIGFLHRHIEGGPPVKLMHHSAIDRENGYRKAMRKAKLPVSCHTVTTKGVVGFDVEMAPADWEVIARHDAVVAYDDDLANLVGRAAYDRGVRVPESLAIASFNGDYASLCAWQRLTTMQIPAYEMGRKAGEMAFELFKGGSDAKLPSVAYRPTLLIGQTT
jgi:LacI family transcriptional regulator